MEDNIKSNIKSNMKDSTKSNTKFNIKLADIPISISALYNTTKKFCQEYLTEEEPSCNISVQYSDIVFEREKSAREDELMGVPVRHFSDNYLETLAVYRKIAEELTEQGILLFHGSAIAVDGEAYIFTAKSGTGKSTHTGLWREVFGDRAVMVNDDKPLLRIADDGVTVYGTPWDGKHRLSNNIAVPLKAVCILERGIENRIRKITPKEALPWLMQQTYRPIEPDRLMKTIDLLEGLVSNVGLYRLECNMEAQAAVTAYEGMQ